MEVDYMTTWSTVAELVRRKWEHKLKRTHAVKLFKGSMSCAAFDNADFNIEANIVGN